MIYTPKYFAPKSQDQIKEFIDASSFGSLISIIEGNELQISKTPFSLVEENDSWLLEGHLAFNNPHLEILKNFSEVTVMFDGSHGYISPMYYKNPQKSVPTWNYSTAILKGSVEVIDDPEWLLGFVKELSDKYEDNAEWMSGVDGTYLSNLAKRAIGFRVKVTSVEAKFKLNQQTPKEERDSLIEKVSMKNSLLAKDMRKTEKWND
jgi:transcriptional regulator